MFGNRRAVLEMPADASASAGGGALGYAGFWARVAALIVDNAILTIFGLLLVIGAAFIGEEAAGIAVLVYVLVALLYWPVMECSARQATFGKSLLGIQVTDLNGARLSFLRSLLRNLAKIISGIPLSLGFLLAAFTSRKQALHDIITSCLVVRSDPSHFLKALVAAVGGLVIVVGGGGYYFFKVYMPQQMEMGRAAMEKAMKEAGKGAPVIKPAPAQPPIAKAPAPDAKPAAPSTLPASLSEADYDKLLARQLSGLEKPSSARAGPALLQLDTFFGDSVWLKVMLPPIPNLDLGRVTVTINQILDVKGQDRYDRDSSFEGAFFRNVNLSETKIGVPHFEGTRSVRLKQGTTEPDVQKVEGVLHLSLPLELKVFSLGSADVGREHVAGPATVTLKSIQGQEASFTVSGAWENFVGAKGFDEKGARVQQQAMGGGGGVTTVKYQAPIAKIQLAFAPRKLNREYPFSLTRGATAPAATTVAAPATMVKPDVTAPPVAPAPAPARAAEKPVPAVEKAAPVSTAPKPTAAEKVATAAPIAEVAEKPRPAPRKRVAPTAPAAAPAEAGPAPAAAPVRTPKYNDVMTAVMYRDQAGASELLDLGWWVDRPDSNGVTPLMAAAMNGDAAMVQLLLKNGANPNRSAPGGSVLDFARRSGDGKVVELLQRSGAR